MKIKKKAGGRRDQFVPCKRKEVIIYISFGTLDRFFAIIIIEGYRWKEIKL